MPIVQHKSIVIVSEPKQPEISNAVFTTAPQFIVDYKYTGAALEDSIFISLTNTLAAFASNGYDSFDNLQTGRTDFNYAIKEEDPTIGSDKEWTTTSGVTPTPASFVHVVNAADGYNKMMVKIENYPITTPKTYAGTYTLINADKYSNFIILSSPLITALTPIPNGQKIWIPDIERHNTIQIFFTGALLPAGKYSITMEIYHKQTGLLLHTEIINFLYDSSKSFDTTFVEHQWAFIAPNPHTGEYDRLVITTDKPTIFTNISGAMNKSIYVRGLASAYDAANIINDSASASFTTKVVIDPDKQERQPITTANNASTL